MELNVLNEKSIVDFQKMTEDLLEKTGFCVNDKKLLKLASKAGAIVDESAEVIRLPRELLKELLSLIPPSYEITTADGKVYTVGGKEQLCSAIVTDPWIIDYNTRTPRKPCLDDIRKHTAIAQKLDEVAAISLMEYPVTDFNDKTSFARALETHLLNHTKHYFVFAGSIQSYERWIELGTILSQGKELSKNRLMTVAVGIVSPLRLTEMNVKLLFEATSNNFAVIPTICPMAGTTSPYSKDGTLLLGNAENIFLAAMTQIINPGNPFLYAFGPSRSNMRTGHDMYYTMDKVLWKAAATQLAKSYGIPAAAECGGTMTWRYDQQNGAEGMLFMLAAQNSGSDFLCGIGSCFNAMGMSAEMMIIHSAWLDASKFLSSGISTNNLSKSVKSIFDVGHGGNYIIDDLTLENLRTKEFFDQEIYDSTGGYEDSRSIIDNAHTKAEELTSGFESPLPDKVRDELRKYFENIYR